MSETMRPMPFGMLMDWILAEYERDGTMFGVNKLCKVPVGRNLEIFGEKLESPFGPAAGPNTQLAQNIIAAYAAGARFFELKTVQVVDGAELAACISRPCILANDEGYNCEWSTELTVRQAFDEYVKAWFVLKLISREFGLGARDGFVFNMSVGYDLEGIKSEKIDSFIEGLKNSESTPIWAECVSWASANRDRFKTLTERELERISPRVCGSITLSTLHGCPPREIESIARYLITEKGLNTFVKCNPTLLGYDFARSTLDSLGFDYLVFDDHHFNNDLQYADAVPMFRRLMELAQERGVTFGVKLTNTFPVKAAAGELPAEEMYMSGRPLYPLTAALTAKLAEEFDGGLRISYCGGADAFNADKLFSAGIWPVTMATTLLKAGGYNRFQQLNDLIAGVSFGVFEGVNAKKAAHIAGEALINRHYRKPIKELPTRKMAKEVPLIDCFESRCRDACPIHQDIPAYLRMAGEGRYLDALRVITQRNPLPFITGTICSHRCMGRCTRNFYDDPVDIRAAKLECAENGLDAILEELKPAAANGKKVAVVGSGPAGLATAFFLARAGCEVWVFEKEEQAGGVVRKAIPEFRISDEAIDKDVRLCRAMGVKFEFGHEIQRLDELEGYYAVVLCLGARSPGLLRLEYGAYYNAIDFLTRAKQGMSTFSPGKNIAIIGGGNTAMDAARAAKRLPGVERVSIVYRRTKRYMPAEEEELSLALSDGVEFCELMSPVGVKDGALTCKKMRLGDPDERGRLSPVETDETAEIPADAVIAAVGETVDSILYVVNGMDIDDKTAKPVVNAATLESTRPGVYIAGDGRNGPATVVDAIAEAAAVARAIVGADFEKYAGENKAPDDFSARFKKGRLTIDPHECAQSFRCLECRTVCECCVDVCPNRANISVKAAGGVQIVHVDGMCNECGNCAVFCPYDSRPYRDKFTLFWSREDFDSSENSGFLPLEDGRINVRLDGAVQTVSDVSGTRLPLEITGLITAIMENYAYMTGRSG